MKGVTYLYTTVVKKFNSVKEELFIVALIGSNNDRAVEILRGTN